MIHHNALRWTVRLLILACAVFLMAGSPLWSWMARALPVLSPLAGVSSIVANRSIFLVLYWLLPAFILMLVAVFRGRFFCRWICPTGTLMSISARRGKSHHIVHHRVSGYVFWMIIGASLFGSPAFIFLDPLAMISRQGLLLRGYAGLAVVSAGIILPAFMVFSLFQSAVWCSHFCPLGYFLEIMYRFRHACFRTLNLERRRILLGGALGIAGAFMLRVPLIRRFNRAAVRPPGAIPADQFWSICSRCYACVNTCPSGVLRVGLINDRRLGDILLPELNADMNACDEFCNACTQACPTGAIQSLSVDEKRHRQIGIAEVRREACLAWTDREYCMVCAEFCPYAAIQTEFGDDGVPCPIVETDRCRGCGFCQYNCPAIRDGKAIFVSGLGVQRTLDDV